MAFENIGVGGVLTFKDKGATAAMSKAGRAFDSLKSRASKLRSGMSTMAGGLRNLALAGAPVALAIGAALKTSRDFGKAIAEVSTLVDTSVFTTKELADITRTLGLEFGRSALEEAPALYLAISAGATDAASATSILTAANKLAIGGVAELDTSVSVLSTSINAFGLDASEAERVSDLLFETVKRGITTVSELGVQFPRVAAVAGAMGVKIEEATAAMASATKVLGNTRFAASGLANTIGILAGGTAASREAAKKMGLEFSVARLKARGLAGMLEDVAKATGRNLDEVKKLFPSLDAQKVVFPLLTTAAGDFKEALEGMRTSTGATNEAFKKMTKTADFQLGRLKALRTEWSLILTSIFSGVGGGALQNFVNMLVNVTGAVKALRAGRTDLSDFGTTAAAIARGIAAAMDDVGRALEFVRDLFKDLGGGASAKFISMLTRGITLFIFILGAIAPVVAVIAGLGFVLSGVVSVVAGLVTIVSALAAPLAIVVAAGAALFFLFRRDGEGVLDFFTRMGQNVVEVGRLALDFLMPIFMDMFALFKNIGVTLLGVADDAKLFLAPAMQLLSSLFQNMITQLDVLRFGFQQAIGMAVSFTDFVGRMFTKIAAFALGVAALVNDAITFLQPVINIVAKIGKFMITVVRAVAAVWLDIFEGIGSFVIGIAMQIIDGFRQVATALAPIGRFIRDKVVAIAEKALESLKNALISILESIRDAGQLLGLEMASTTAALKSLGIGLTRAEAFGSGAPAAVPAITAPVAAAAASEATAATVAATEAKVVGTPPPAEALTATIKDERKLDITSKLCVDGKTMAAATKRHEIELSERAGFGTTPWARRVAVVRAADLSPAGVR